MGGILPRHLELRFATVSSLCLELVKRLEMKSCLRIECSASYQQPLSWLRSAIVILRSCQGQGVGIELSELPVTMSLTLQ